MQDLQRDLLGNPLKDIDVRTAVREDLRERHLHDLDTLIVEEMGIWAGSVRVDIAVINGEMHGVELKSERDNLLRLPAQASLYNAVFDKVTLVVAEKHRSKAEAIVPQWWGIVAAASLSRGAVFLQQTRPDLPNPDVDPMQIARLLWKSERLAILERWQCVRGYRSAENEKLCRRMVEVLSLDDLRREARSAFKARYIGASHGSRSQISSK